MKLATRILIGLLCPVVLATQVACAQRMVERPVTPQISGKDRAVNVVANSEVACELTARDARERITGRISFNLVSTPEDFKKGRLAVRGFNVSFFGVSQELLAGDTPVSEPLGLLAFAVTTGKVQTLQYDGKRTLSGELEMFADASFLNAFAEPSRDSRDGPFETPVVPSTGSIRIELEEPISGDLAELQRITGEMDLKLRSDGLRHDLFEFPPINVVPFEPIPVMLEIVGYLEGARRLCIQPVRLLQITSARGFWGIPYFSIQTTGAGLAFGEPALRSEWKKVDVLFEIRNWMTLWAGDYWILSDAEKNDLVAEVDVDDCIEVFFVYDFDPNYMWGCGGTRGPGTAGAKIISSDRNARGGIDFTHLAHEVGHVLGLLHPGDTPLPSAQPASTGTLMCPSGCLEDNPQVNSLENEDLVSNPLLEFIWKLHTAGPDCINSTDCGPCP